MVGRKTISWTKVLRHNLAIGNFSGMIKISKIKTKTDTHMCGMVGIMLYITVIAATECCAKHFASINSSNPHEDLSGCVF